MVLSRQVNAMKTTRFKCRHCGRLVFGRVPDQKYCGEKSCQAARKRKWSRKQYVSDPDYRLNQKESTAIWLESRGGAAEYYRDYRRRKRREAMVAAKELEQRSNEAPVEVGQEAVGELTEVKHKTGQEVDRRSEEGGGASLFAGEGSGLDASASRDATCQTPSIKSGIYKILPSGANRDAVWATIEVISGR